MGCVCVDKMVDYMEELLCKIFRDELFYVCKIVVICVVKFFDLNLIMCIENGFFEIL